MRGFLACPELTVVIFCHVNSTGKDHLWALLKLIPYHLKGLLLPEDKCRYKIKFKICQVINFCTKQNRAADRN